MWVRIPALTGSPRLLPGRCTVGCPLLQVCTLGWVKCREHISLLIILCIIVYVTNKAHPSLICICRTLKELVFGFSLKQWKLIWHFIILTSINAQILLFLVPSPFFHSSIKFSPHRGANLSTPDKHKDSLSPQISSLQIALPAALRIRGEITPNIWKCSLYLKSVIKEMRCVRKCKV